MPNSQSYPRINAQDLKAVWKYRSLIWTFAINEIKTRYRNTHLGYFWSLLEPLTFFGVLYVVFTVITPSQIENYALYLFLGIMLYHGFSKGTSQGMESITSKSGIINLVALPKEVAVLSTVLSSFITLLLDVGVFLVLMVSLQYLPPITILLLPLLLALELVLVLGISFALSVLSIIYKDLHYVWQVALQLGFWISPIAYKTDSFPSLHRTILGINPIGGIIELGHELVLGTPLIFDYLLLYTLAIPFVLLVSGYAIFKFYASGVVEEL